MNSTDATNTTEAPPVDSSVAETLTPPPPLNRIIKDDTDLKLLMRVGRAFEVAAQLVKWAAEQQFHVVVDRTCGPLEVLCFNTEEELRKGIGKLRNEVHERYRRGEREDVNIYVFYGVRYHLQKWPFAALVHNDRIIPLDPLDNMTPVLDDSGSLFDPVAREAAGGSLGNPSPHTGVGAASAVPHAKSSSAVASAVADYDDTAEENECGKLPPDPAIIY